MTKTYKTVEMQIVRLNNNDVIATSNITTHPQTGSGNQLTPGRKGIWD